MHAHTVIAVYRPRPGQQAGLDALMKKHLENLRSWGMATDAPAVLLKSKHDGSYLEIFDWVSKEVVDAAHHDPRVLAMWDAFGKVCDYVTLKDLHEGAEMFASFERIEL
ncbi:MAG: hypothetical protein Q8L48_20250 [Archangium sp.]|nr:hypothetical protein [Archangium sp.]